MPATDMHALGRLGQAVHRPSRRWRQRGYRLPARHGAHLGGVRRRRLRRALQILLAVCASLLAWLGAAAVSETDAGGELAATAGADLPARPDPSARVTRGGVVSRSTRPALAEVDGLALRLPHPRPVALAFHEAGRAEALALAPVGRLLANDNPTRFAPGPDSDGPGYRILSSRGRARPPTSAVDVVVGVGDWVGAPVSGRVVEVREYALYGSQRDWRVVIEPEERPDLQVVLVHLYEPEVEVADRLRAGEPLAKARLLPLRSQVDSVTGRRLPHVHIEVKAATEVDLVDPNAPALPADAALDT